MDGLGLTENTMKPVLSVLAKTQIDGAIDGKREMEEVEEQPEKVKEDSAQGETGEEVEKDDTTGDNEEHTTLNNEEHKIEKELEYIQEEISKLINSQIDLEGRIKLNAYRIQQKEIQRWIAMKAWINRRCSDR